MKNFILSLAAILLVLLFANCSRDNFLDFQPKGVVIPSSVLDYRNILDQVNPYTPNGLDPEGISRGFGGTHTVTSYYNDNQDIVEDLLQDWGFSQNAIKAYTFQENLYSVLEDDPEWSTYYNQIYTVNVVLDGLAKIEGNESEVAELVAEARLHRAYAYFNLVNLYCVHYDPATATTDLGVPIREGIELNNLDLTRASVQETYDYLLKDIVESYEDLKDFQSPNFRFRPSKAGASGLLAKIYLYQGKYELALDAANQALNYHATIRQMQPVIPPENTIFFPIAAEDEQVIWYKYYNVQSPLFVSPALYRLYESEDLRKYWFVPYEFFFNKPIKRFIFSSIYFSDFYGTVGINTADIMLIQAECHARLGNIPETNASLNTLRENRFAPGTYQPIFIKSKAQLLKFVKDERRREMVSSLQRTFDVKRYNRFDDANIRITHSLGGVTATIEPNSLNWAMPIASKYIQQNPEIVQNPRD